MKKYRNLWLNVKIIPLFLILVLSLDTVQAANQYEQLFNQYSLNTHNKPKALVYAREYLTKAKKDKDNYNIRIGYSLLAGIQNDVQKSMVYIDSMFAITNEKDTKNLVFCYTTKGRVLYNKRFLKEALTSFIVAKRKIDGSNEIKEAEIDYYIASIKNIQGNSQEALTIFLKLKDFYLETGDTNSYVESLISIADCYFRKNRLQESYQYVQQGKKIVQKVQDSVYNAYFESIDGKILFKKHNYDLAIKKLKKANFMLEEYDPINFAENSFYIGESYKSKGDLSQAVVFYKTVDEVFVKNNYIYTDILEAYDRLIAYHNKRKDLKQILYYTTQKSKADSLLFSNSKYFSESIFKNVEIKEVENKSKSKVKWIIFFSTIIIVILLCILYYVIRLQKNKSNELEKERIEFDKKISEFTLQANESEEKTSVIKRSKKETNFQLDKTTVKEILKKLEDFEKEKRFIDPKCSLDALAKEIGTNSTYLSRIINEEKKVNFPTYLNNLRIDYLELILASNSKYQKYSIKALALEIGYNNVQSFSRAFLSRKGVNASTYLEAIARDKEFTGSKNQRK